MKQVLCFLFVQFCEWKWRFLCLENTPDHQPSTITINRCFCFLSRCALRFPIISPPIMGKTSQLWSLICQKKPPTKHRTRRCKPRLRCLFRDNKLSPSNPSEQGIAAESICEFGIFSLNLKQSLHWNLFFIFQVWQWGEFVQTSVCKELLVIVYSDSVPESHFQSEIPWKLFQH